MKYTIEEINQKGVYSGFLGRMLYEEVKYNKEKEIAREDSLNEATCQEFENAKNGGIITFSTDVSNIQLLNHNVAWTIGNYFNGRYKYKNGKSFNKKSLSLEIMGISSQQLLNMSKEICADFHGETVLVKDFSQNKIFLINAQ